MRRPLRAAVATLGMLLLVCGCGTLVEGKPLSIYADPFRVAGLDATDGPSGVRPDAPGPTRDDVENGDDGDDDLLAVQAISDVEEYWQGAYGPPLEGEFEPVDNLLSYDSDDRNDTLEICEMEVPASDENDGLGANAIFVPCEVIDPTNSDTNIAWDRGYLIPALRERFGDMGVAVVLAHEYGHSIDNQAKLTQSADPLLVGEQLADCFAGGYMRWVAEGKSKRFTLNTSDGLNDVLAAVFAVRDSPAIEGMEREYEHGSAFERISAFQVGFTDGPAACAEIDEDDIETRRSGMPQTLEDEDSGELQIDEESVSLWVDALNTALQPANPPQLTFDSASASSCSDARPSPPVSYCPATNTIAVDLPALEELGQADDQAFGKRFGDNSAYSVLTSRYMLAIQHEKGLVLNTAGAALRTACLTGAASTKLSEGVDTMDGKLSLSAGDVDEAVAGMLTNGLAASDANGTSVPSGFSRVDAFRIGVFGDTERCYARYQ